MDSLDPSSFVDHPFEEAPDRFGIEWTTIGGGDVGNHLRFALRRVYLQREPLFDVSDLDRATGSLIEKSHQLLIDLINSTAPAIHLLLITLFEVCHIRLQVCAGLTSMRSVNG